MRLNYTPRQGQFLAFIHYYTKLNGQAPAERYMELHFKTSPPAVHQMVLALEKKGFIQRTPGMARSIRLLLPKERLPDLESGKPALSAMAKGEQEGSKGLLVDQLFPSVAQWVAGFGWIEIGEQEGFGFVARALDEGGMVCEVTGLTTLGEAMLGLEKQLGHWFKKEGIATRYPRVSMCNTGWRSEEWAMPLMMQPSPLSARHGSQGGYLCICRMVSSSWSTFTGLVR